MSEYVIIDADTYQFLESYDPHWQLDPERPQYRSGRVQWTTDRSKAMKFPTKLAAFELWTTQSKTFPLRPDGKPNKPLTFYTILVERLEPV